MKKLLLILLCLPMIGFAQERYSFLETTCNGDPGTVLLYSTNQPVTGFIIDTTLGYLSWEKSYYKGIEDGFEKEYYENGQLRSEIIYKDGKKEGLYKSYHENSQLKSEIIYKDGKEEGKSVVYDDYGKGLVHIEEYFKEGYPVIEIKYLYDNSDKLIRKETRKKGESLDRYTWKYRLGFNTIETFHNLYDCKGIFCSKKQHYEYILNINCANSSNSEYFLQCEYYKISEYELFISKHKRHKFTSKAKEYLLTLKQERDYKLAKEINRKDGYNEFISLYPNSKKNQEGYNDGTLERIILIDLITEYNNILNLNSVKAWEEFLLDYPTNCNVCMSDRVYEDAKYYLSFSKDFNAWAKATDEGTYESYSEYLVNFTPLRYNALDREIALERIDSLVEPEWEKVKKKNSIISYREFIESYINISYVDLAYEAAWKKAKDKNRITYYERYLDHFPDGKYGNEALKAMLELEMSIEAANKNITSGALPSELPAFRDYDITSAEHRFIVVNATRDLGKKTPETLLVSYRGVKTQGDYLKGKYIIKIDECKEIILPAGSYFFEFESKDDKTITKYRNLEAYEFIGGYYSSGGYIYVQNSFLGQPIVENPSEETFEMLEKKYNECTKIKH
tara:strand:+ start:762 stop:2624 length:1863 start_codon:yes stop_codon:yes gene_type:complete